MADEPENHTLRLLREMREEMTVLRDRQEQHISLGATMANNIDKIGKAVVELQVGLAAGRADQGRMFDILETFAEGQQNHGTRLNAIDGRLALIEKQTGLVKA